MSGSISATVRAMLAADGLAWQNLYRRGHLLPGWTRRKRREIEAEHEAYGIIDEALPFALNQPTAPFRNFAGVNSEWLAFQLKILVASRGPYVREAAMEAWRDLAQRRDSLRLTVGQHAALKNIAAGVTAPTSGHDNPHYFDDSACFRAVALVCANRSDSRTAVVSDAEISNAQDGIWAAQALAAALRAALDGAGVGTAVTLARESVPTASWSSIEIERALSHSSAAAGLFDLIGRLAIESTNHAYDYGNLAPETLAITLTILDFTGGELEPSLLAALSLPKTAASVAPMVGALCGALGTADGLHFEPAPLEGLALPHLAGVRPLSLLDELLTSKF